MKGADEFLRQKWVLIWDKGRSIIQDGFSSRLVIFVWCARMNVSVLVSSSADDVSRML